MSVFDWIYHLILDKDGDADGAARKLVGILVAGVCFTSAVLLLDILILLIADDHSAGTFGDFFGGVLNPLLGFLTLIAVLMTFVLQKRELSFSVKELRKSSRAMESASKIAAKQLFESRYFSYLELHNVQLNVLLTPASGKSHSIVEDVRVMLIEKIRIMPQDMPRIARWFYSEPTQVKDYFEVLRELLAIIHGAKLGLSESEPYVRMVRSFIPNRLRVLLPVYALGACLGSLSKDPEYAWMVINYQIIDTTMFDFDSDQVSQFAYLCLEQLISDHYDSDVPVS